MRTTLLIALALIISAPKALAAPPAAEPAVPAPAAPADAPPSAGAAPSEGDANAPAAEVDEAAAFEATLKFQQGKVTVGDGLATLNVPNNFRYLSPADAERVLVAWGNPPGSTQLGMLFPTTVSPTADDSWGVVISYTEEGHVKDDDADDVDYAELLTDMKKETQESNAEREKQGFGRVSLIGWAEPPHYDAKTKKMYWAKELDFGGENHTLNYDIRVLGRKGVLELSAVASVKQLSIVKAEMPKVLAFVEFNTGSRYADFNPDVDTVAAYGIGALVAGKLALKAGMFKIILAGLLASKKLLVAGGIAVFAAIKAMLGRKSSSATSDSEQA